MRNFIKNVGKNITTTATSTVAKMAMYKANAKQSLQNQRGDTSISQAVAILTAIVIGALLLAGLYMLFEDIVLVELSDRIKDMFDYAG